MILQGTVLKALSGRLAKFKQPKRVVFVDALPRNTMGKVQKNVLRERFADLYSEKTAQISICIRNRSSAATGLR